MARTRTLLDLIADVRSRTNMETSTFVTDAEVTEFINQALSELWVHLSQNGGQPFYQNRSVIAVTPTATLYALPADFGQLQGVEGTISGWTGRIEPFMPAERAGMTNNGSAWMTYSPVKYRLQGGYIEFLPAVNTFSATVLYTPACPRLVNLSDTFDGFDGYEVAAIYGACATVQAKEDTDFTFYANERDRIYRTIDSMAAQRDMSAPERVQDVRGDLGIDGPCGWWGR